MPDGDGERVSGLAPLRVRDYRLMLAGLVVSSSLMPLQFVTQIFWIQEHVSDEYVIVLVGLIGTIRGLGALTFGLYGGALADRFDRRKLLMVTQSAGVVLTLAVALLMWQSDGGPWALALFFGLTLLSSGTFAIDLPTRQAMMPDIVGPRLLPAGISLNTAGAQIAMPVSLFASGLLIEALGFARAFALSAGGLAFEVVMVSLMRFRAAPRPITAGRYGARAAASDVRDGIRYTRGNATVMWVIILLVAMMALGFPAVANLGPTWITTAVGVSVQRFGFVAVTWGLGAFLASVAMARFARYERKGVLLSVGALTFSAGFAVFAIPTVATAVIGNLALGVGLAMAQISATTIVQLMVPNEFRGRVMSLLQMNMAIAQLLTFPVAWTAQATSLEVVFPVLAAAVALLVIAIVVGQWRRLSTAGQRRDAQFDAKAPTMGTAG